RDVVVSGAFSTDAAFDPNGTYLVTGGSRGMGLEVVRWLRARGAGHVIAVSRGGAGTAACANGKAETPHDDEAHEHCSLDITDAPAVEDKLAAIERSGKPLKGVIHAAVVYHDALLADMTDDAIESVLAPKVQGAINLTRSIVSAGAKPDFFLSFSSAAQTTGWPGQSNYTSANSVLEALARHQRQLGISGQCVHWGVFGDTGHVAASTAMSSYLESAGWESIDSQTVRDLLPFVLDCDEPVLTIADADWPALAARYPPIARAPRFNELLLSSPTGVEGASARLWELNGEMTGHALHIVREQVGKVLRVEPASLVDYETISDAGIDSLSAFELRNRLEQETNLEISLGRFVGASRFDELAELLCALARDRRHADAGSGDNQGTADAGLANTAGRMD
ncbi:MAG: beta-ketoacyl reductase, partial [Hyphomicrobiaceae bacterium]